MIRLNVDELADIHTMILDSAYDLPNGAEVIAVADVMDILNSRLDKGV